MIDSEGVIEWLLNIYLSVDVVPPWNPNVRLVWMNPIVFWLIAAAIICIFFDIDEIFIDEIGIKP